MAGSSPVDWETRTRALLVDTESPSPTERKDVIVYEQGWP